MAFETLFDAGNASVKKFESIGDQIEGRYMGSFDFEGDYGPNKKHVFNTSEGAVVVFGQAHLKQLLPLVKPGTMVRVTLTGEKAALKKGRHPMKLFTIEQDKTDFVEVAGVDFNKTDTSVADDTIDAGSYSEEETLEGAAPPRVAASAKAAVPPSADRAAAVRATLAARSAVKRA